MVRMKALAWALMILVVPAKLVSVRIAADSEVLSGILGFGALVLLFAGILVYAVAEGLSRRPVTPSTSAEPPEPKVGCAFGQAHRGDLELIAHGRVDPNNPTWVHVYGSGDPRDHGCASCQDVVAQRRRDLIRADREAFTGGVPPI